MEKEPYGRAKTPILREKILEVLRKAERPLYIAEIQRRAGIKVGTVLEVSCTNLARAWLRLWKLREKHFSR